MKSILFHNVDNKKIVCVQILFNYGAMFEPIRKNGYVHLLEHIKIASDPFKDYWFVKKSFSGTTTKEYLKMSYMVPNSDLLESVFLLGKCLSSIDFRKQLVEQQKKQVINEIKAYSCRLSLVNVMESIDRIYRGSGVGNCAGGDIETVNSLTLDSLSYYNEIVFKQSPYIFTCVGDLNGSKTCKEDVGKALQDINIINRDFCYISDAGKKIELIEAERIAGSECIYIYRLPGRKTKDFLVSKIIEIAFRNIFFDHYVLIRLYPLYHESLFIIKISSDIKTRIKEVMKKMSDQKSELICPNNIIRAVDELRLECLYQMTSLKSYAEYLLGCDYYGYDMQALLNNIDIEVVIKLIRESIMEMMQTGPLCKTITKDMVDDDFIMSWELDMV